MLKWLTDKFTFLILFIITYKKVGCDGHQRRWVRSDGGSQEHHEEPEDDGDHLHPDVLPETLCRDGERSIALLDDDDDDVIMFY